MGSDLWCNSSDAIVRGIVPLDSSNSGGRGSDPIGGLRVVE
jgi:hypothetical protein